MGEALKATDKGHMRQLPSGRWQVRYRGPDRLDHKAPSTFETFEDARRWLDREQLRIASNEWIPPVARPVVDVISHDTLTTYADTWLTHRPLKPRTREDYHKLLDRQILPTFGHVPLRTITTSMVRVWYTGLGSRTPTLRARAYGLLRTILGSAVDDELIKTNPCHIRGAGSVKRAKTIRPATLDELGTTVEAMPEKYQLMVLLAAWCAFRFGELAEMRRKDVDLTHKVIRVRRGVVRTSAGHLVDTPKTEAGMRDVSIPPHLLPIVKAHLGDHAQPGRDGLLFPAASGGHLSPSTLQKPYERARKAAGRPDLRFHDLRHTGAVLAAATGATLAELMARLGHSTAGAALRYQHAAQDRDRAIAEALSKMAGEQA